MGQHLQRHVLEGTGGAVPELQAVGPLTHRAYRGHFLYVKTVGTVGLVGKAGEL